MAYDGRWFEGEFIKITITHDDDDTENKTTDFHIPKALLVARSKYFMASQNFREGQENHITFNDWCVKAFRYVLTWIYQGHLEMLEDDVETMIRAYEIADFLMIRELKNALIANIQEFYSACYVLDCPSTLDVLLGLELPLTDKLIQFMIDKAVFETIGYMENDLSCVSNIVYDLKEMVEAGEEIGWRIVEGAIINLVMMVHGPRSGGVCINDPQVHREDYYYDDEAEGAEQSIE